MDPLCCGASKGVLIPCPIPVVKVVDMPGPFTRLRFPLLPYDVRCPLRPGRALGTVGKDMPIKQAEHTGSSIAWTTSHRTVRRKWLDGHLPAKP